MNDLHDLLQKVLNEYASQDPQDFPNNPLAKLLRNGLKDVVSPDLLAGTLRTTGSAGRGRWAQVPWLCVADTEISQTAQRGFYLAYLFVPDMSGVYLSLHQGWAYYYEQYGKKAKGIVNRVSAYWQTRLTTRKPWMTASPIDLLGDRYSKSPTNYEQCNIVSTFYRRNELPDNARLVSDLKDMLVCYSELKSRLLNPTDFGQSIRFILSQASAPKVETAQSITVRKPSGHEKTASVLHESEQTFKARQVDFDVVNQQNAKIGFLGEELVMAHERQKLKAYPDLQAQVEQVSQTKGDGLGYDVKSFDLNGHPIFIEVKTTTANRQTPFYISRRELEFSKTHTKQYRLYRLYDFDRSTTLQQMHFFETAGDLTKQFGFSAVNFISGPVQSH